MICGRLLVDLDSDIDVEGIIGFLLISEEYSEFLLVVSGFLMDWEVSTYGEVLSVSLFVLLFIFSSACLSVLSDT